MQRPALLILLLLTLSSSGHADGVAIGKIYQPYVQPQEQELEYRLLYADDIGSSGRYERHQFGYGRGLNDRHFAEIYLVVSDGQSGGTDVEGVELEYRYQLTEQGEYNIDWGIQFELEREFSANIWESSATILAQKELGDFSLLGNFSLIYEFGSGIQNEWETALSTELRYRWRPEFEPGLALYAAQNNLAVGPLFGGQINTKGVEKWRWEFGAIAGLDNETPDYSLLFHLEYEFF